ncbi:hypothetical protein VHEMI08031 [[Torrubiella] hemipterigena]|uniref:Zn(2)-C6 fungal-type domain-containing protein n=1 Tax=[Torrubiella] hemipterigena TaxID=1531966 RepID=A0A0A1T5D2_9HYPO|nr:hypothetical protein VHEMI08031 [[Torrubiella] hemipterigena]
MRGYTVLRPKAIEPSIYTSAVTAPRLQKKQHPRSRTGCLTCRNRRVKCDESQPICKRCAIARLACEYRKPKQARQLHQAVWLQPATVLCPDGIQPVGYEIDLFGTFRSSMVTLFAGMFNNRFWRFDVPTAAQVYPSMWHAAVALTAIHKSIKVDKQPVTPPDADSTLVPRNQLYRYALMHFNKSIQYLATVVSSYGENLGNMRYKDKEMIIMTNILYIGLCGVLRDEQQVTSQCWNLVNILETMKFGEEDPSSRRGIMAYKDLLSIILIIDTVISQQTSLPERWARKWVVKCPAVNRFTSMTDAYLALLPTQYPNLLDRETFVSPQDQGPLRTNVRLDMIEEYNANLDAFVRSGCTFTPSERETIDALQLFMDASVLREQAILATTREEVRIVNDKIFLILDRFEQGMARTSLVDGPYSTEPPPFVFGPSYGKVLQIMIIISSRPEVRWKGIELMRKWPYNEATNRSEAIVSLYEAMMEHCRTGPERTLPFQKSGLPIAIRLSDSNVDPYNGCECIPDYHICGGHKMGNYERDLIGPSPRVGILSWYERLNNLPISAWYPYNP